MRQRLKSIRPAAVKSVLEALAAVAVIAGVPLFIFQLDAQTRSSRVTSAIQFAATYDGDNYLKLREKLEAPWLAIDAAAVQRDEPSEAMLRKLRLDVWRGSNVTKADLVRMTDFYRALLSCRSRSLCDETTVDLYFHDDIVGFYCNYDAALAELAEGLNRPRYLDPLKQYSGQCRYLHG